MFQGLNLGLPSWYLLNQLPTHPRYVGTDVSKYVSNTPVYEVHWPDLHVLFAVRVGKSATFLFQDAG